MLSFYVLTFVSKNRHGTLDRIRKELRLYKEKLEELLPRLTSFATPTLTQLIASLDGREWLSCLSPSSFFCLRLATSLTSNYSMQVQRRLSNTGGEQMHKLFEEVLGDLPLRLGTFHKP
jgi:hypothetical protein